MTALGWIWVGGIGAFALLYALSVEAKHLLNRIRIKSDIKKRASAEHVQFLTGQLKFKRDIERQSYLPLWISSVAILSLILLSFVKVEAVMVLLIMVHLGSMVAHAYLVYRGVVNFKDALRWNREYGYPEISNFLTRSEVYLLLCATSNPALKKRDVWKMEGEQVFAPDKLVSILSRRLEIQSYLEVKEALNTEILLKEHLMTPEQKKRNAILEEDFIQSIQKFEPLLLDLLDSTKYEHSADVKRAKTELQGNVERLLSESEQKLRVLNQANEVQQITEKAPEAMPTAIQDLKRVEESEQVSNELRERASNLIQQIMEKSTETKSTTEREMAEMNARAVIKASECLYNLEK